VALALPALTVSLNRSFDFVFTKHLNNSGFGTGMLWFYVLPLGFLLTIWFFATPICYPETQTLPASASMILSKNPIYVLVRGYRAIFLENQAPAFASLWKLWLLSCAVFVLGHAWFYKLRKSFADLI